MKEITRRALLQAGAAVLAPFPGFGSTPDTFTFAFFSDTHIGLSGHMPECGSMFREMSSLGLAFGLNGGDITDYGFPGEYANYRQLVDGLPFRIYTAPGNHDVRWSPLGPHAYREGTGNPMYSSFDHKGVHVVLLDSTIPLSHYGHFEKKMLHWLEQDLKHCGREAPVFLAFHHWVGRDGNQTDNETDLLRIIEPYNVKILLNGHGHSDLLWTWNGIANTMNKGLYQLSYERIDVDRVRGEVRLSRRTKENPDMRLLLTLPLAASRDKRPVWPIDQRIVAGVPVLSGLGKEYRWDDRPWKPLPANGAPTDALIEGTHRLTYRDDANTYRHGGLVEIRTPTDRSRLKKRWDRVLDGGVMSHLRLNAGILFVSTMGGDLYALGAEDGKPLWTARMPGYCHSSPLVLDGGVIVGSSDEYVRCFDRTSGREKWKFKTGGPVYSSAAHARGVAAIGSGDGWIYGLQADTGSVRWKYQIPPSNTAFVQSPACTDGERFYFGAWDKFLYALEVESGQLVWKADCCGTLPFPYSPAIGGPVVAEGKVYVPTDGNLLLAFEAATGKLIWKTSAPGDKVGYSGPCLVGDRIYIGCLGDLGQARCFSARDGAILWTADIGSTIYDSSPSYAGGKVAIGSVIGLLTVMDGEDGRISGQYQLPPGHFLASPVSELGRVYAASYSNHVAAFDLT